MKKKMKKRLFSALLCLCMVCSLMPATAWAADPFHVEHTTNLPMNPKTSCYEIGTEESISSYYCDYNNTYSKPIKVLGTVNLCLNGKTLTARIWIGYGMTLNICDCVGTGKISYNGTDDSTISSTTSSHLDTVNLYSGTIEYTGTDTEKKAIKILNNNGGTAIVNLYGGTVKSTNTEAIEVSSGGQVNLCGDTTITVPDDKAHIITKVAGAINADGYTGGDLRILVDGLSADDVVVTNVTDDTAGKFSLTNSGYHLERVGTDLIYKSDASKADTPAGNFNATGTNKGNLAISNYTSTMKYSVNGGSSWNDVASNNMEITNVTAANDIKVKDMGNNSTTTESDVLTIDVTQPAAPSGLIVTQPSSEGGKGSIATTTSHEYSTDGTNFIDCNGPLSNLDARTYYVREKANGTALASENAQYTIVAYSATPTYGITFTPSGTYNFEATVGYEAQTARTVTVNNVGNQATGVLSVALSGTNAESFTLGTNSVDSIDPGSFRTFTVVPKTGLSADTYTATVIVSGGNGINESFNVKFTVNASGGTSSSGGGGSHSGGSKYTPPTHKVESGLSEKADGSISFSTGSAKKDDIVTINVKPEQYYQVDKVIVKDSKGNIIDVKENKDGTFSFTMPDSQVTVEPVFTWDNPFTDVSDNSYYTPAVEWALKKNITTGIGTGDKMSFNPTENCTRAQMATFLWRAAGSPDPVGSSNPFDDVSENAYYAKAVQWVHEQGITGGTSATTFSPNLPCTRAQMVTFLHRVADTQKPEGNSNPFTDVPDTYYTEAVQWAYEQGITGGTSATTFSPNAKCGRGQMVTFLYNFFED